MPQKRPASSPQQERPHRFALASFIKHATDVLTSSDDYAETLSAVARLVIPEFADWTTVHVKGPGEAISWIVAHRDPAGEALMTDWLERHPIQLDSHEVIPTVLRTGKPVFSPLVSKRQLKGWAGTKEAYQRLEHIGTRSVICVPLSIRGEILGALTFVRSKPRRVFSELDLVLAQDLARRAAVVIDRAQMHQTLKQQQAMTAFALRAASTGTWQLDLTTGRIVADENLASVHGLDGANYPKTTHEYLKLVHPDDRATLAKGIEQAPAMGPGEAAFYQQYRILRRDGETRWVEAKGQIVEPGLVRGVVIDITDRKTVEQQLEHSQKLETMARLAGGMAHDFNNVLSTIIGFTEILLLQLPDTDPMRNDVQEIQTAATRAVRLSRQLLGFGRPEDRKVRLQNLNVVIARVAALLSKAIGEDVQLRIELDPELAPVRIDAGQFEQVLMNLAVNARDAMPRGGLLTIATTNRPLPEGNGQVVISVRDTGCGIDAELRQRIFEPFFTTKGEKGSGLGLPTSLKLVHDAGGEIVVASEPGRGSTFDVKLPAALSSEEEQLLCEVRPSRRRIIECVLVVDDDEGIRRMLGRLLIQQGFEVIEASTAARALALVAEAHDTPVDLLVTDVIMAQGSGIELAANVRAIAPGIPIIFMTGQVQSELTVQLFRDPTTVLLKKPFTVAQVEAVVAQARKVADGAADEGNSGGQSQ